ncbi:MAG: beta-lactamase domain protein [Thermoleophilia bacterium]|nr:beta-lactamase domain protein [Thermoleophilia bacterium]
MVATEAGSRYIVHRTFRDCRTAVPNTHLMASPMNPFQLIPIGTSPAWYNPGEPNSGFLLEAGDSRILVDCGSGVIARYLALFGAKQPIDAVVITHVHADHCLDLVPLKYGISLGTLDWQPQLWLPPGARRRLDRLVSTWDGGGDFFEDAFEVREYDPGEAFRVGAFDCSSIEVPHYVESFALRFEHEGSSFGYTADLGPNEQIIPFMQGVDVLLAEAALPEDADLSAPDRGHITASEAGQIAASAAAHSLLLTHVPIENGFDAALTAARSKFVGPTRLATSGECYPVAQRLAVVR